MATKSAVVPGVIEMLKEDHRKVKGLFDAFASAEGEDRSRIVTTAIFELETHADLEETIVYPAIREEINEDDMMSEAVEEHHLVHVLIKELKELDPSGDTFQAKFTVLGDLLTHHIQEEENEMFPRAERHNIDWDALEVKVVKRKGILKSEDIGRRKRAGASAKAHK